MGATYLVATVYAITHCCLPITSFTSQTREILIWLLVDFNSDRVCVNSPWHLHLWQISCLSTIMKLAITIHEKYILYKTMFWKVCYDKSYLSNYSKCRPKWSFTLSWSKQCWESSYFYNTFFSSLTNSHCMWAYTEIYQIWVSLVEKTCCPKS